MCSFLQVYQEKVYDLLNPRFIVDLPVREHPKKGMYDGVTLKRKPLSSLTLLNRIKQILNGDLQIPKTNKFKQDFSVHEVATLFIIFQECTLQT